MRNIEITSPAFNESEEIPDKYTCNGENINPELNIENIPENTNSLVLIVDDPDAPTGTFVHWVIFNLPVENGRKNISEDFSPKSSATEGINDFSKIGYGGPCPPGKHRYFFKLYALDTKLDLSSSAKVKHLENAMEDNIIEKAKLVGIYER